MTKRGVYMVRGDSKLKNIQLISWEQLAGTIPVLISSELTCNSGRPVWLVTNVSNVREKSIASEERRIGRTIQVGVVLRRIERSSCSIKYSDGAAVMRAASALAALSDSGIRQHRDEGRPVPAEKPARFRQPLNEGTTVAGNQAISGRVTVAAIDYVQTLEHYQQDVDLLPGTRAAADIALRRQRPGEGGHRVIDSAARIV